MGFKYLYYIFRLFKCSHKYKVTNRLKLIDGKTGMIAEIVTEVRCVRCGKLKIYRLGVTV